MNRHNPNRPNTLTAHALQDGSIELVVLGMLAALIVVLAIPLFIDGPANMPESEQAVPETQTTPNSAAHLVEWPPLRQPLV